MNLGAFDRKLIIEEKTVASNDYSDGLESWSTILEIYAKLTTTPSRQNENSEKIQDSQSVDLTVHFTPLIKPDQRFTLDGNLYYITSLQEIVRRRKLKIIGERSE